MYVTYGAMTCYKTTTCANILHTLAMTKITFMSFLTTLAFVLAIAAQSDDPTFTIDPITTSVDDSPSSTTLDDSSSSTTSITSTTQTSSRPTVTSRTPTTTTSTPIKTTSATSTGGAMPTMALRADGIAVGVFAGIMAAIVL
ncbi:hypothetical protein B0H34DRAFT_70844 [Crassisporium funariophilum]|nr:hypothetical protein B0H34DRAFT_70844 [Crassisporium funariophilum]